MLARGGQLALRGVPDLSLDLMLRLAHGALLAQGAESWTSRLQGHRVHRYAFNGTGNGPAVLLLHGLGGSASSIAALAPALLPLSRRVVLLELPGHGRSPAPQKGPLAAREYGAVVVACAQQMATETGGKVLLMGNSLGGALALYAAHERPDLCAGVVGLNPAGAELSDEAMLALPRSFPDPALGAAQMARMLFHKTPWPFWLVARDFARHWGSPTVQRILDDARSGSDRSLGIEVLTDIHVPVLILWGADDRLLPLSSVEDFARIRGARVEMLHACGHVPQLEKPALTRRAIADFVRELK
jgi:pimeloyl-ACP methyl ester carboxylesterase